MTIPQQGLQTSALHSTQFPAVPLSCFSVLSPDLAPSGGRWDVSVTSSRKPAVIPLPHLTPPHPIPPYPFPIIRVVAPYWSCSANCLSPTRLDGRLYDGRGHDCLSPASSTDTGPFPRTLVPMWLLGSQGTHSLRPLLPATLPWFVQSHSIYVSMHTAYTYPCAYQRHSYIFTDIHSLWVATSIAYILSYAYILSIFLFPSASL